MTTLKFYDKQRIGSLYLPRLSLVKEEAAALTGIGSAASDPVGTRTALLLIDCQIDFCHADGALSVPGAGDDIGRMIEFIIAHLGSITAIYPTLDTHLAFQIFYGHWWLDREGRHPAPFTIITDNDIRSGKYRPAMSEAWSAEYPARLLAGSNKPLCIWPEHTMLGTPGHALVPALYEICYLHAIARKTEIRFRLKGDIPESEMYGVFAPEVSVPDLAGGLPRETGNTPGGVDRDLLEELAQYDRIIVMGEAKSHCVLESVRQFADHFAGKPATLAKMYVAIDCMSPVRHPEIDFDAIAKLEFAELAKQGINLVTSEDIRF